MQHTSASGLDAYVTRERAAFFSLLFIALTCITLSYLFITSHGLLDDRGRPIGTDFAGIWSAGVMTRDYGPESAYNFTAHNALQQRLFGAKDFALGYHYPPIFTFLVEPISRLPYLWALAVYQLVGLALYLLAMRLILHSIPRAMWLLPVIGFPAVWVNLMHAHNGFLTAAFFGAGLALLPTRPILAGIALALLCYKPQFGLLIPLALIAASQWRAFFAASATVIALLLASYLRYGEGTWIAFFHYSAFTQQVVIEGGTTGWHKMQTVFAAARLWNAPIALAYAAHAVSCLVCAVLVFRLWRSQADYAFKASSLILASMLCAPYAFDYDLMLLAPALAFLGVYAHMHGAMRHLPSLLAALWLMPFFTRLVAEHFYFPIGVISMGLLLGFVTVTARSAVTLSTHSPRA